MPPEFSPLNPDDLLAPLPEDLHPRLGGPGPFVINLSASHSPIAVPKQPASEAGSARHYQIKRHEDGRVRYRLRLGPFASEDEAIAALEAVRKTHPTALTATAEADDLRAIEAASAKTSAKTLAKKAANAPAKTAGPGKEAPPAIKAPSVTRAASVSDPPLAKAPWGAPAKGPAPAPAAGPTSAFAAPPASAQGPRPAAAGAEKAGKSGPGAVASAPPSPRPHSAAARPPASLSPSVQPQGGRRVPFELEDKNAPHWFAVHLATSNKPFDFDAMPQLDILTLYRLYPVAGVDQGRATYVLRLGFFSDEAAALAVCGYLKDYFEEAIVTRVSVAERERYALQADPPRAKGGAFRSLLGPRG